MATCGAFGLLAGPSVAHTGPGFMTGGEQAQGANAPRAASAAATARPVPRPHCRPGSRPETGMQGRVPASARSGFTCNLRLLGHEGVSGGYKVERFVDRHRHECAFYDGTLLFPGNAENLSKSPTGTPVLDMSNPARPRRTTTLMTPAMQTPHESLLLNKRRGLLAATTANPTVYPSVVDIYDVNEDCRHPALQSSLPVGILGHESGFAPDGNTYYTTSLTTGGIVAVDVSNPKVPKPIWFGRIPSHGMTVSNDGRRGYVAGIGVGLIIIDLSQVQARKQNPQVPEISRLSWPERTIPQVAQPVTIRGRHYLVEVDEFSTNGDSSSPSTNGSRVGAARIIDIENEKHPRVVSNLRLAVHQPQNRARLANDPGNSGALSSLQGYAGHYCTVPRRNEPGIVGCSFILSGLRIFDIRDPYHPRELAYFAAPLRSNSSGVEPSNYAMSGPAYAPSRREVWYSDGVQGFYAVRLFKGIWPSARSCLARRSPIGPRNIGRVRLRYTRRRALRRIAPKPVRRGRYVYRWCVKRSRGRVTAVFSRRSRRGRIRLVTTTARAHGMRGVHRGSGVRKLRRRFRHARRIARGVYRAGPHSRRLFGVRHGKVRFVAVADKRLIRHPRTLRRYVRRAGFRG
ncbi:MAG: LVIVD repeat-containing protein [Thermoleophilaceae bacterium]